MKKITSFLTVSVIIFVLILSGGINYSFANHDPAYRDIDGNENNIANPSWGNPGEKLIRNAPSDYSDGVGEPAGQSRNSAREISNAIFAQSGPVPDPRGTTNMFWLWGQFVDHDIDLTGQTSVPFPIPVPPGDPVFDPFNEGDKEIFMTRSIFEIDPNTGIREQINQITSFLDASTVYGSDQARADHLRTSVGPGSDGKLRMDISNDPKGLLPLNDVGEENANAGPLPVKDLFLAGDIRANEQAALTAMHTLFVREHNRLVDQLALDHPDWDGDRLYEEAKIIVEGEIHWITYEEFLPILLGSSALEPWTGYDDSVDPQITNEFSTAAYRFGHDAIASTVQRLDADGNEFIDSNNVGHLTLVQAFFNPTWIKNDGIDEILRGMSRSPGEKIDHRLVDELRNLLFGPPGSPGTDLAALDIQRGRDHGLPDYNTAREKYGLPKVTGFDEITPDPNLQAALQNQYGSVDDIDLWVGGLSEKPAPGSMLGPLFSAILKDQFERLRDGDRYWYQNRGLDQDQLDIIENSYLSDIIMRNTEISSMQSNVFLMPSSVVVGGEMIPVDKAALLLAGASSLSIWVIPIVISLTVVFLIKQGKIQGLIRLIS